MKKIKLFALIALSLAVVACDKKDSNDPEDPEQGTETPATPDDPQDENAVEVFFVQANWYGQRYVENGNEFLVGFETADASYDENNYVTAGVYVSLDMHASAGATAETGVPAGTYNVAATYDPFVVTTTDQYSYVAEANGGQFITGGTVVVSTDKWVMNLTLADGSTRSYVYNGTVQAEDYSQGSGDDSGNTEDQYHPSEPAAPIAATLNAPADSVTYGAYDDAWSVGYRNVMVYMSDTEGGFVQFDLLDDAELTSTAMPVGTFTVEELSETSAAGTIIAGNYYYFYQYYASSYYYNSAENYALWLTSGRLDISTTDNVNYKITGVLTSYGGSTLTVSFEGKPVLYEAEDSGEVAQLARRAARKAGVKKVSAFRRAARF